MPDISRLVIEVDSSGVLKATGNLDAFGEKALGAGKNADDLAKKFGTFQLIIQRLPGPLRSVASGLTGMVSPGKAAVSVLMDITSAVIKFSKEGIAAYQEQEVQFVRLNTILESTGAKSWATANDLNTLADTLRRSTGRSSNDIMQMQSVLLGFTNITGENYERLVKNMINMADVMGVSLAGSANILGRALESPTASLDSLYRKGITFTEEQKRMVRTLEEAGRLQEAQVIYLEAMEKSFGNAAAAVRDTRGATIDWKLAVEDLQIEYGRFFNSILNSTAVQRVIQSLTKEIEIEARFLRLSNNLRDIKRENDAAMAAWVSGIYTYAQAVTALQVQISEVEDKMRKARNPESLSEYNLNMGRLLNSQNEYLQKKREAIAAETEYNRLQGIQTRLGAERAKIENAFDNTSEGRNEALEREIQKWLRIRDTIWETDTGIFEGIGDKHTKQIDIIVENLRRQQQAAGRVTKEYKDWVVALSSATGFSKKDIGGVWNEVTEIWEGGMKGLGTVEKYVSDVVEAVKNRFLAETPDGGFIYEALGLNRTDVYEDAVRKMQALVQAMTEARIEDPWSVNDESYAKALEDLQKYKKLAMEQRGSQLLSELTEQLKDASKTTYELAVKRLMIERNISEEAAKQVLQIQRKMDYITNGHDLMGEIMISINDALKTINAGEGGYGQYAEGKFKLAGLDLIQGTDVGNFVEGTAMGGPLVGLINMLVGALVNVIGGLEGVNAILSPVTDMLKEFEDVFKALLLPALIVARVLVKLAEAINWLLNKLTFGLINEMARLYDSLIATNDERQKEEERLRALNAQYAKLYDALKKQEEYYLTQRRNLYSQQTIENFQNVRHVNDMILSPHGAFSTNPRDYIIATKHPETLMSGGGGSPVYITVINNANADVKTEEMTGADGSKQIQIIVDSIVQQGFTNGRYDNVLDAASQRRAGKRVHA
jgi:hypothetical protein